jgi:hypothetical protein
MGNVPVELVGISLTAQTIKKPFGNLAAGWTEPSPQPNFRMVSSLTKLTVYSHAPLNARSRYPVVIDVDKDG